MRKLWRYIIPLTMLCAILASLTSCRQKDLLYPEAGMNVMEVRFKWPDEVSEWPDGMTLWFFSASDGAVWRFDIPGAEGGPVEIPYGDYTMISCRNDVARIRITDASSPSTLTASLIATDSVTQSIKPIYRAVTTDVSFTPSGLGWTETGKRGEASGKFPSMTCHPCKISTTYDIHILNVEGMDRIQSAIVTFHGVCQNLLLREAESIGTVLNLPSYLTPSAENRTLTTSFESFGPMAECDNATVEVIVNLKTRRSYRKSFDVAEQLANRPDSFYVKLIIDNLSIPDDEDINDDDVGMEVEVDGWTEINIDYTTGP